MRSGRAALPALAPVDSSSGAASAASTNPAIVSGVAGRTRIPPVASSTGWRWYRNRVATPKLPPPPADRPEEVRMAGRVDLEPRAVRRDDLGAEEVVDRKPVLAHHVADAAAEREPADPDRAGVAEADAQPVRGRRRGHLARGEAGLRPRSALLGAELHALQRREVEDDPAVARAMPRAAVAAAPDRELEPRLPARARRRRRLVGVGGRLPRGDGEAGVRCRGLRHGALP